MFTINRATFVLFFTVLSIHSYAGATSLTEELYVTSGLEMQVQQLAPAINAGIQQSLQKGPDSGGKKEKFSKRLQSAVTQVYGAEPLKRVMLEHLTKHLNKATTNAALAWLRSDLGRKVTQMEIVAMSVKGQQEATAYYQTLEKSPPEDTRVDLVAELVLATKASEVGTDTAINIQAAIIAALLSQAPKSEDTSLAMIKGHLEKQRDKIGESVAQQSIMSFLYTYRDLSDKELGQYIKFANSKAGQAYHDTFSASLNLALTQAGRSLTKELSRVRL